MNDYDKIYKFNGLKYDLFEMFDSLFFMRSKYKIKKDCNKH
jgi:hypothetical protein